MRRPIRAVLVHGSRSRLLGIVLVSLGTLAAIRGTRPAGADEPATRGAASVEAAREQARLVHDIYATTLDVVHQHYFRANQAVLPARAMEDVFTEVARQSKIEARWIAVNTKPMSVHHEPKSNFERLAAKELAAGKDEFEQVDEGVYQRAAPIPLGAGCAGCHDNRFGSAPQSPRLAGLVIRVPLAGN